ncbi:MAG: DUF4058 family protein [Chloroflexi bacterium]|nr:DUF4058 family protein [Chloroflexota bacterium]
MPSPFPGMDPYLEGSEWTSVHTELSSEIARQLAPKLRPKYIVRTTRRFVTEMPEDIGIVAASIYPDAGVLDTKPRTLRETRAGATMAEPLEIATVIPERVPQVTLEIRDVAQRELVTAIEVLSPTNKHSEGYLEYLDKRRRVLYSRAHLMEIDLLRTGRRVPMQEPLPPAPYFVFLSRAERRPITQVWPIPLNTRLPAIPVPLLPGDPDVPLDLQLALNTVYDALNYDLSVDYTRPPEVPLESETATWASERLRAAGFAVGSG